jgi:hypothetical protein
MHPAHEPSSRDWRGVNARPVSPWPRGCSPGAASQR